MKSFKQHLEEHSGHFSRQWLDQDTIPSAPHALEALNSLIGQMAEQEYLNLFISSLNSLIPSQDGL